MPSHWQSISILILYSLLVLTLVLYLLLLHYIPSFYLILHHICNSQNPFVIQLFLFITVSYIASSSLFVCVLLIPPAQHSMPMQQVCDNIHTQHLILCEKLSQKKKKKKKSPYPHPFFQFVEFSDLQ